MLEHENAERQIFVGQGDVRNKHRGVQMPIYDQSEDLDCYLNRFELQCFENKQRLMGTRVDQVIERTSLRRP